MKYYIGIDLGGTNIKAGVVNENFEIVAKTSIKTNCPRPSEEIMDDMAKVSLMAVEQAGLTMNDIEWVGVGTPGIANSSTGIVEYSCNLDFHDVPMADYLSEKLGKPVFVDNDANAAAYGEFVAGAAKGANNAVAVTLGTGVGGGIIIDGKIYSGSNFAGAELGHEVIVVDGAQCSCGRKGCFEAYSSASGLIRMTKEAMEEDKDSIMWPMSEEDGHVSGRLAFNAMRKGDASALVPLGQGKSLNAFTPIFRDRLCKCDRLVERMSREEAFADPVTVGSIGKQPASRQRIVPRNKRKLPHNTVVHRTVVGEHNICRVVYISFFKPSPCLCKITCNSLSVIPCGKVKKKGLLVGEIFGKRHLTCALTHN